MWWRGGRTSNLPDFTLSSQIRLVVAGNAPFATPAYPEGSRSRSIATVFLWIYSAWILHFAFCIFWSLFILWDAVLSPTKKDDVMHQQLECCETERVLERVQGEAELQLAFFFFFFLLPGWLRCWRGRLQEPQWQERINFFIPSFLLAEPRTLEILRVFSYYFCRKNDRKGSRFGGFNSRVLFFCFFWGFFFFFSPACQRASNCTVHSEFLLLRNTKWPAAWPAAHLHQSAAANPQRPVHLLHAAVQLQSRQSLGYVASWISLHSLIPVCEHWTDAVLVGINVSKQVFPRVDCGNNVVVVFFYTACSLL